MAQLAWFEDPDRYLIDLPNRPARVNDAYSQWVIGHGAKFNLTEEYRGPDGEPDDFDFAIAYPDLDGAPNGFLTSTKPATSTQPARDGLWVGRLPVRRRSVAPSLPSEDAELTDDGWQPQLPAGVDPSKLVIVAVMDDAINIAHRRFRDGSGESRVDAAWIQDARFVGPAPTGPGRPPLHRLFGRVWDRGDINAAIAAFPDDDEGAMRALDLISGPGAPYRPTPLRLAVSHGTHVADLAAGYAPDDSNINRRVIAVQLPVYASMDTSGATLKAAIIAGGEFIFDRARALSRRAGVPIPVVLNFSYGLGGGVLDGQGVVERALSAQANAYRDAVERITGTAPPAVNVLPAGNEHLSTTHARSAPSAREQTTFSTEIRLQPDDRSSNFAEFWVPHGTLNVAVQVTGPDGSTGSFSIDLPSNPPDPGQVTLDNDRVLAAAGPDLDPSTIVARLSVDCPSAYPRRAGAPLGAWRVLLAFAPSRTLIAGAPTVAPGIWQVITTATGAASGRIEAWVQRNERSLGFPMRGRQAYFDDDEYADTRFDAMTDISVYDQSASDVRRNGTISSIASRPVAASGGAEQISVGASRWDIAGPAIYSAAGMAPNNTPIVLAAGDTSRVLSGVLASATRGSARVALSGTSSAAPQIARFVADVLEATPQGDYGTFSAHASIAAQARPPVRPNGEKELASNNVVREERSELGSLDPPLALQDDISRDTSRKLPF
ncbi:MAG: hypothetical protein AAGA70_16715 [Pseudomonadota bacterium]